jgi:hypothetical protein
LYNCADAGECTYTLVLNPLALQACYGSEPPSFPPEFETCMSSQYCDFEGSFTFDCGNPPNDGEPDPHTYDIHGYCFWGGNAARNWCDDHVCGGDVAEIFQPEVDEQAEYFEALCPGVVLSVHPTECTRNDDDMVGANDDACPPDVATAQTQNARFLGEIDPTLSWISTTLGSVSYFSTLEGSAVLDDQPNKEFLSALAFGQDQTVSGEPFTSLHVVLVGAAPATSGGSGQFTVPPNNGFEIAVQGLLGGSQIAYLVAPTVAAQGQLNVPQEKWVLDYADSGSNAFISLHLEGTLQDVQ